MPLLVIDKPGIYEINQDYTAQSPTDDGIVIAPGTNNVRVYVRGRIECRGDLPTNRRNAGIRMNGNHACQIIGDGGHLRGFGEAVSAESCDNLIIKDLFVMDGLLRGIRTSGANTQIRDCTVRNIFGSTFTQRQYCMGIEVSGPSPEALGNIVEDFYGTADETGERGEGVGISFSDGGIGAILKDNIVQNKTKVSKSIGYWLGGDFDGAFIDNHAANLVWGAAASSPTQGTEQLNTFDNCDVNFLESQGDWRSQQNSTPIQHKDSII